MFETATVVKKVEMKAVATGKFHANVKSLAILDKFERQEDLGWERKPQEVKANEAVLRLEEAFKGALKCGSSDPSLLYSTSLGLAKRASCSAKDIEDFSRVFLVKFQEHPDFARVAGLFLSALVNSGGESEFVVSTANVSVPVSSLGYQNTKNLVILGDAGGSVGWQMAGGSIIVKGNAGATAGTYMEGGSITVNGNAGDMLGMGMKNGRIDVGGNAGSIAGKDMRGGSIAIKGHAGDMVGNDMAKGTIKVNGGCKDRAGLHMGGGMLVVNGNSGIDTGHSMGGGVLVVNGSAGTGTGNNMEGGRLSVNGKIAGLSRSYGGDIYQYNRPIVKNGEKIGEIVNE